METNKNKWIVSILVFIILFSAAIRIRLLAVPLERDEGEYAYAGQLILQGIPPYQLVYNMKLPGIYAIYAVILALFGQTHQAIHFGLLLVNTASIVLVFCLAKRLTSSPAAIFAAAAFAILSLLPQVLGFTANAEPFVLVFALGGILLILRALDSEKHFFLCIASGAFLLGLGFIIKQHGAVFLLFSALLLFFHLVCAKPFQKKKTAFALGIFAAAAILPFALTCLILFAAGVFSTFWFWTFQYAREYVAMIPWEIGKFSLKYSAVEIFSGSSAISLLAVIGIFAMWIQSLPKKWLITFFLLFSFAAVSIGFFYRPHYFIFLLPAVAILSGIGLERLSVLLHGIPRIPARFPFFPIAGALVLFFTLYHQFHYFFLDTPHQIIRSAYGTNPFEESLSIADFIRKHTGEGDSIAVIGSEPQIYFYSKRRSATGHIYTYALMEEHPFALQMQREMIQQIENAKPKFLVFINVPTSWLVRPNSGRLLASWFKDYATARYDLVGAADILPHDQTIYYWNPQHPNLRFLSSDWIQIFQRKDLSE